MTAEAVGEASVADAGLVFAIALPLIAAIAATFVNASAMRLVHILGVAGIWGSCLAVTQRVAESGPVRYTVGGYSPPLGIELRADGVTAALLLLTALIATAGSIYARALPPWSEPQGLTGRPLFWPVWYLLWGALNALFLAADIFNLYVALELVTLAAIILVAQTDERPVLLAAARYLLVALFGSLLYLLGVVLLYGSVGALDMELIASTLRTGIAEKVAAVLITCGLLVKTALFPFYFWLPPAHAHAAAPVSAVLSSLVVKTGFYLQARFWLGPLQPIADEAFMTALGLLGGAAILWGAVKAVRATRLKLVVVYSTVSQLGYLFLLFPLLATAPVLAWSGAFFHVLAHATAKAAAFLAAGNILYALKEDKVGAISALGGRRRMSVMAFALAGVSLIGLPPSGGFVSKWLLLQASASTGNPLWIALLILGSLIAAIYIFRILGAFLVRHEQTSELEPLPRALEWSALGLGVVSVLLGPAAALALDLISIGAPADFDLPVRQSGVNGELLLLILFSSFIPAVIVFFLKEEESQLRSALNLTGSVAKVILVILLLAGVWLGYGFEYRVTFLPGLDLALRADPLSLQFALLSAGLWLLTTIYAIGYLEHSPDRSRFFGFFNLSVTASIGIALSGNLITFLFFYEFLTLATYPLVVHRGTDQALKAGRTYLIYTLGGGAALLLGTSLLHAYGASLEFLPENSLERFGQLHPTVLAAVFALLIGGLGVKAALVPVHGWLPAAMVAPAPVSALLHAVAVVKAGAFGIIRVLYDIFGISYAHAYWGTAVLAVIAGITIVYGSIRALTQDELKRRLAYSTVSQLSYITLGAALAGPVAAVAALVHIVHQGLMKITLFLCAGNLAEAHDIHKVHEMDGAGKLMPWTMCAFTIAAFGMIGLPPVAGFVSKWYLAGGGIEAGSLWVVAVLAVSSALNAAYFLPIIYAAWFRPLGAVRPKQRTAGWWLILPPVVTAVLSLAAGVFAAFALSPLGWAQIIAERTYFGLTPAP